MTKLKIEDLENLKTDVETCIKLVKEISANYDKKVHYAILTPSITNSVIHTINSICYSTGYLEGYYITCDEIHPVLLTEYLLELKQYNTDKDILSYFVAFYLKRKINSFYTDLKRGSIPMGIAMLHNDKERKKYYNTCYERATSGLKLLRSKK